MDLTTVEPIITPLGHAGRGKVVNVTNVALINDWFIVYVVNKHFQMAPFIVKKGEAGG